MIVTVYYRIGHDMVAHAISGRVCENSEGRCLINPFIASFKGFGGAAWKSGGSDNQCQDLPDIWGLKAHISNSETGKRAGIIREKRREADLGGQKWGRTAKCL